MTTHSTPTQMEMAAALIHEMRVSGDELEEIEAHDLLDDLACAGLKLAPDFEMAASKEWFAALPVSR